MFQGNIDEGLLTTGEADFGIPPLLNQSTLTAPSRSKLWNGPNACPSRGCDKTKPALSRNHATHTCAKERRCYRGSADVLYRAVVIAAHRS